MNRALYALAASLALTSAALADGPFYQMKVAPIYGYISAGAGQMALSVTTNTTLTVPTGATLAEICVETAGVRYRDDGTAATALLGLPVSSGTCFAFSGPLSVLSFTAQTGSPTIDVLYYKAL